MMSQRSTLLTEVPRLGLLLVLAACGWSARARLARAGASLGLLALVLAGCTTVRGKLFLDIVELQPLSTFGFDETYPTDINDLGKVVGKSEVDTGPCGSGKIIGPLSTATLWENGVPSALSTSAKRSEALKINNKDEVLYVQYGEAIRDTNPTYFLWKNGTAVNLSTLVPGLVSAIDLNDSSLILGVRDGETPFFLYDAGANTVVSLPDLVVAGAVETTLTGVDNVGRVVASVLTNRPTDENRDVYWLPAGGTSWTYTGISLVRVLPGLSKSGLVFASCLDRYNGTTGCYVDLNNPVVVFSVPLYRADTTAFHWGQPYDAAQNWLVGFEYPGGPSVLYGPTYIDYIHYIYEIHLKEPGWDPGQVRGVNVLEQVMGWGTKNYGSPGCKKRGWVAKLVFPITPPILGFIPEIPWYLWGWVQELTPAARGPIPWQEGGGIGGSGEVPVPIRPSGPR